MASDVDASQRFLQEARSATAIEHPNVVEVLDMGRHDDSTVYMVFELLRGESLADRLDTMGPLSPMQAAMILLPVADALAAAHRLGIVHRDVKPDNIFLEDDGMGYVRPKLLDFGIARVSERKSGVTRTGVVAGTPGYLSPEHAQGFRAGPASDVWSLGVVLFECVTGDCPFESHSIAGGLMAIVAGPLPSLRGLPNVPEPIAELVERTLVRDPSARFPDGAAFCDALAAASQVEFVPSHSRSVPSKILLDAVEISLSSAHRVEARQASAHIIPGPRAQLSKLEPTRPSTPPFRVLLGGKSVAKNTTTAYGIGPQGVPTLDAVPPILVISPNRGLPEAHETIEHGATVPRWRSAASVALPVLLLFLAVMAIAYKATRPEGARAVGSVQADSLLASASVDTPPTPETSASDTSEVGSGVGSLVAPPPTVAPATLPTTGAIAEAVPTTARPAPRARSAPDRRRPAIQRGANGSLILD